MLAEAREITAKPGGTVEIPIRIEATGEKALDSLRVSVNRARAHFVCSVGPQISLKGIGSFHKVGLTLPADYKPGVYSILVSDAWSSELRKGLPGPCTPLIRLIVKE